MTVRRRCQADARGCRAETRLAWRGGASCRSDPSTSRRPPRPPGLGRRASSSSAFWAVKLPGSSAGLRQQGRGGRMTRDPLRRTVEARPLVRRLLSVIARGAKSPLTGVQQPRSSIRVPRWWRLQRHTLTLAQSGCRREAGSDLGALLLRPASRPADHDHLFGAALESTSRESWVIKTARAATVQPGLITARCCFSRTSIALLALMTIGFNLCGRPGVK